MDTKVHLYGFAESWTICSRRTEKKQQLLSVLLTALRYHIVLPHRMPPGDSFCSVILVYCPLPALSPSAWGEFLRCCCSSMAACQLPEAVSFPVTTLCWLHSLCLAKLNQLVKTRHANLSSIPGDRSFPFFCEHLTLLIRKYKNKKMTQLASQFQEYSQNLSDVVARQGFSGHRPLPSDKATWGIISCYT